MNILIGVTYFSTEVTMVWLTTKLVLIWVHGQSHLLIAFEVMIEILIVAVPAWLIGRLCTRRYREFNHWTDARTHRNLNAQALATAAECRAKFSDLHKASNQCRHTLVAGLIRPRSMYERISETFVLERQVTHCSVTIEGHIPPQVWKGARDGNDDIILPVLVFKKGYLLDHFEVRGKDGDVITKLSNSDSVTLIAYTLHLLLLMAARQVTGEQGKLPRKWDQLELLAIAVLARDRPARGLAPRIATAVRNLGPGNSALEAAASLMMDFATSRIVFVPIEVSKTGRFVVNFRQDLNPRSKHSRFSIEDHLATFLGAAPVKLDVEAFAAHRCTSYHAHVSAPPGVYLARQEPLYPDERSVNCLFQQPRGQGHAHFYAHKVPISPTNKPLIARFEYYETPPGSTMRAAVAASATCALILLLGWVCSAKQTTITTDAAAFLLVFPAVAAAWLGFESPREGLLEGTLGARLSLISTAFLSLIAAGLFIFRKERPPDAGNNKAETFDWPSWSELSRLPAPFGVVTDAYWAVLVLASLISTLAIWYIVWSRTRHFIRTMTGRLPK